jgi:hypothetical protein
VRTRADGGWEIDVRILRNTLRRISQFQLRLVERELNSLRRERLLGQYRPLRLGYKGLRMDYSGKTRDGRRQTEDRGGGLASRLRRIELKY